MKSQMVRARPANAGSGAIGWSLAGSVSACFLLEGEVMIDTSSNFVDRSFELIAARLRAALLGMTDYRLARDTGIGATRELRGSPRLASVRAASNRAASAAKAGVGPSQRN